MFSTWAAARDGWSAYFPNACRKGRVVGMDISDEMVRRARRNHVALENTMFVIGGVDEIPWGCEFFHTSRFRSQSAYYWPDPARGLREILRVLREGGSAWVLINYYRDNAHCHQWAAQFATPAQLLSAEEMGRNIPRRGLHGCRASPHSRSHSCS